MSGLPNYKKVGMILLLVLFTCNNVLAGYEEKFDINSMMPIFRKLQSNGFPGSSVGFDYNQDKVVWIDLNKEVRSTENSYNLFLGRKVLSLFPEVDSVWLNTTSEVSNAAVHITRKKYTQSGLAEFPMEENNFVTVLGKDLGKYADEYWDSYCYEGENGFDWSYTRNHMTRLFGKRLKAFITDEPGAAENGLHLKIYGLPGGPDNMKALNEEIAKAFALSIGRYESQYWYCIQWCELSYYQTDGKKLFDIYMWQDDFQKWFKAGFDYNQWYKYCEVKKYDKKLNFVTNEKPKPTVKPYPEKKPAYGEVLKFIQSLPRVKMLLLGQGAKGLDAFLEIDEQDPAVINKREMEISLQLMEMGLNSVRFITRNGAKKRIIYLDRERYHILMLFNPEKKYDFPPDLWPIMAKQYWKVD